MKSWLQKIKKVRSRDKWILLSTVLIGIFWLSWSDRREKVIFLKSGLPKGTLLQPHHFFLKPISPNPKEVYFTIGDTQRVIGATLLEDVAADEPLTSSKIKLSYQSNGLSELIPKGMRAHTLLLPKIPPLKRNDFVDVFLGSGKTSAPSVLVEALKVLEVRKVESYFEVTLVLSPQEIEFLERARQKTNLFLVIRNPKEIQGSREKALTQSKKSSVKLWVEVP